LSQEFIPYGRQWITDDDIQAVVDVLRGDWITQGPKVVEFEESLARYCGSKYAVAVSSGTAALHCAMYAMGIGPGDEVVSSPITFAATANSVIYMGAKPVFVDVEPGTLLINPDDVERKITEKTKAIISVDYAGHPCEYDRLREIVDHHSLSILSDSCHALGAEYQDKKCGAIADLTTFSFHPVKHITTGEGGMITTDNFEYAERMRRFRSHGISADHAKRKEQGTWYHEMVDLGFNYRITDFQCALGINQMAKLPQFLKRRREIAARYDEAFGRMSGLEPLAVSEKVTHAYHLYVVRVIKEGCGKDRDQLFDTLRNAGLGVNVHYIPVHLHPYYRERLNTGPGMCPVAEKAYEEILSIPIHPLMTQDHVDRVIGAVNEALSAC
jgi:perosamine synthetase